MEEKKTYQFKYGNLDDYISNKKFVIADIRYKANTQLSIAQRLEEELFKLELELEEHHDPE